MNFQEIRPSRRGRLVAPLVVLCACSPGDDLDEPPVAAVQELTVETREFSLTLPAERGLNDVAIGATQGVRIRDRARVVGANKPFGAISNAGGGGTDLGVESRVGDTFSVSALTMRDRARIEGNAVSAGAVTRGNGTVVTGQVRALQAFGLAPRSWQVEFPPSNQDVTVPPDGTQTLQPGSYRRVVVYSRATLTLAPGTYHVDELDLEPQSRAVLRTGGGPVILYIRSGLIVRGQVIFDGPDNRFLVGYAGTAAPALDSSIQGTLVAPNASVRLGVGGSVHAGAVYARQIEVDPDVRFTHRPFADWKVVPFITTIDGSDAPVVLRARIAPDGQKLIGEDPDSTEFRIPDRLEVECGNAGNGRASLSFSAGTSTVQCTYRGGASAMTPTTALERARGMFFDFVSCSNGAQPGATLAGTDFRLELLDPDPAGRVCAEVALGDGCSSSIGYPIDPEDSILMRDGFSWSATQPLPELDALGRPNLFYANIYVSTREQRELLDVMQIHYRFKPLLTGELARFRGKCGGVNLGGDGEGIFTFAVIPAAVYNFLRTESLQADPTDPTLLRAVVLRDIPPELRNPQGAFSYEQLGGRGFRYEPGIEQRRGGGDKLAANQQPFLGDVIRGASDFFEDVGNAVATGLSEIDKFFAGSVQITVDLHVHNRDPAFQPGVMRRLWGAGTGNEMILDGVDIEVWSTRFGFIPEMQRGTTGANGRISVEVADGSSMDEICVELENEAARLEEFIGRSAVCDFRDAGTLDSNRHFRFEGHHWKLHLLNQLGDGRHYLRDVVGHDPTKATVLAGGLLANATDQIFAPCLDFPSVTKAEALGILATFFPAVAVIADVLIDVDIVFPSIEDPSLNSRGVPTHEYGHYAMCDMLFASNPVTGLSVLLQSRIAEGAEIDPGDETAILAEGFADFFAMQVAAGVNYTGFFRARDSGVMNFCRRSSTDPAPGMEVVCMDRNFIGNEAELSDVPGRQLIGARTSLFLDAVDGVIDPYGQNTPNDGQILLMDAIDQLLRVGRWVSFIADEGAQLSGPGIRQWFQRWQDRGVALDDRNFLGGLNDALRDEGESWCARCQMFALHHPATRADVRARGASRMEHLADVCMNTEISDFLGEPPPVADVARLTTTCAVCPEGQVGVGAICQPNISLPPPPCPPTSIDSGGVCVPCGPGEFAIDNVCLACPPDRPFLFIFGGPDECVAQCPVGLPNEIGLCPPVPPA